MNDADIKTLLEKITEILSETDPEQAFLLTLHLKAWVASFHTTVYDDPSN